MIWLDQAAAAAVASPAKARATSIPRFMSLSEVRARPLLGGDGGASPSRSGRSRAASSPRCRVPERPEAGGVGSITGGGGGGGFLRPEVAGRVRPASARRRCLRRSDDAAARRLRRQEERSDVFLERDRRKLFDQGNRRSDRVDEFLRRLGLGDLAQGALRRRVGRGACFVLVSSPLVRSPGERSAIMAMKLFAASMPGKLASTPMNAAMDSGAAKTIVSAPPAARILRRRLAASSFSRRARPAAVRRRPERGEMAATVIQSPEKASQHEKTRRTRLR